MFAPRLLLSLALAAMPAAVYAGETRPVDDATAPDPSGVFGRMLPKLFGDKPPEKTVIVSAEGAAALSAVGWKAEKDGTLVRIVGGSDKGLIPVTYLDKAGIKWRDGSLYFDNSPYKVGEEQLGPILRGLASFTDAARIPPKEAGATLALWGLPPGVDGRRLYNPGGDATYLGMMMRSLLAAKPDQVGKLGVQRTTQALDLIDHAYGQAFSKQRADIAQTDFDRAKLLLYSPPRAGETPLLPGGAKPFADPSAMLGDYKKKLEAELAAATKAGDEVRRKDSAEALAVLNNLEKQRFYKHQDMAAVPSPAAKPDKDKEKDKPKGKGGKDVKEEPYVELATGLPGLLRVLDRLGDKPLTSEQQEQLIKAFPMGDLVWRMGAQDLWKQGLTGKGVKVAVIDEGIAENPELGSAVKSRVNFTSDIGANAVGSHGTHVAGIIHALAPQAELNGYAVFVDEGNDRLRVNPQAGIIAAIHRAVKDGNQIINMSLGSSDTPGGELSRVVEEYASKGVVFVVAAGNSRDNSGGIDAPSSAPSAITVGALDSAGRMADFSSFGDRFDPGKLTTVVKEVFLAPGSNIVSTLPPSRFGSISIDGRKPDVEYGPMSGTSMATPALAGVSALLVQDMLPNPVNMAARLKTAMSAGMEPVSLDRLPPTVPMDQTFVVVNPLKALENQRREQSTVLSSNTEIAPQTAPKGARLAELEPVARP